jgi:F-type H+-transporting ATPase subunit delta
MKISKQSRRGAKELFRSTFVNGVMDPTKVRQTVQAVISQKPRGYMPILEHLARLVKLEEDRRSAVVESAIPIPPEKQTALQESMTRVYGRGLNFSFVQNPNLIGGLRIRVGSDVIDGSIRSRLDRLAEAF